MTSARRSVVVTGLGCISSLGHNTDSFWDSLKAGKTGIRTSEYASREELGDTPLAEVKQYHPEDHFDRKSLRLLDRASEFALIAASEAIAQAKLEFTPDSASRTGIVLGSAVNSRHTNDEVLEQYFKNNRPIPPTAIPKGLYSAAASHISMQYGITGPAWMVNSACSSSNQAIAQGMDMIVNDQADIVITGGTDTPLTVPFVKGWSALRILDPLTCRPFSKDRQGLVLGEGAGIVVLEEEQSARQRGAQILAKIIGYGCTSDAFDLVKVSRVGAATTMRKALKHACLDPSEIDYINAHGTGTKLNDTTETLAIHDVFSEHAKKLSVSSTKSMHGHALGASSSLELIATVQAINKQCIPPTANFTEKDPECDLDYVPNILRHKTIKVALSNSFAFGGLNVVLVISKF